MNPLETAVAANDVPIDPLSVPAPTPNEAGQRAQQADAFAAAQDQAREMGELQLAHRQAAQADFMQFQMVQADPGSSRGRQRELINSATLMFGAVGLLGAGAFGLRGDKGSFTRALGFGCAGMLGSGLAGRLLATGLSSAIPSSAPQMSRMPPPAIHQKWTSACGTDAVCMQTRGAEWSMQADLHNSNAGDSLFKTLANFGSAAATARQVIK